MYTEETKLYYLSLVVAIILTVFLLSFLFSLLAQYKKNRQLYRDKIYAEINASEDERTRIAADIHDDVGPLLSVVRMQLETMRVETIDKHKRASSIGYLDNIMERLTLISDSLIPSSLAPEGFLQALKDYCNSVNSTGKIKITHDFRLDSSLVRVREIHLYRVIHELIHNAVKHSKAEFLDISAHVGDRVLVFKITDNGKGFNFHSALKTSNGRGLKNVMNRLELINGKMYIDSSPKHGTNYLIEIPVDYINNDDTYSNSR